MNILAIVAGLSSQPFYPCAVGHPGVFASHAGMAIEMAAIGQVQWLRVLDSAAMTHIWIGGWSFLLVRSWMYRVFELLAVAERDRHPRVGPKARTRPAICCTGRRLAAVLLSPWRIFR